MVERVKSMRTAVAPAKSPTKSIASLMTQTTDIENDPKMLKRIQEEEGLDIIDEDKYFDPDEADQFEQNEVKDEEEQEKEAPSGSENASKDPKVSGSMAGKNVLASEAALGAQEVCEMAS